MCISTLRTAIMVAIGTIVIGVSAWSQSDVGSISGAIVDSSGASVPARTQLSGFLPDLSLLKNFPIGEKTNVQFRAESFNFLNHPSFTGINTSVNFTAAGQPTQNFGAVTGAGPGRVIEFGLKLIF